MEDQPPNDPAETKEEEKEEEKEKKGKEKADEAKEHDSDTAGGLQEEEEENEEYEDAEETSLVKEFDTLRLEEREARQRARSMPQQIPPALGDGPWWPSAEEWHLAVINARWRDQMESRGVPYPTAHMSMAQLEEWRLYFQVMYDCEPWEYDRVWFDSQTVTADTAAAAIADDHHDPPPPSLNLDEVD